MIKKYISVKVLDEKYTLLVERDSKSSWFVGQCKELPAALSQGKTLSELVYNIKEAIELVEECKRDERKERLRKNAEQAMLLDATVKKNNITMEEIVAELKKVRQERYNANKSDQKE